VTSIDISELAHWIGREIDSSDWLPVTQERVSQYADAVSDHNWMHVDPERATREIGGTIAHGNLILGLTAMLSKQVFKVSGATRAINYGWDKVRFPSSVPVGKRIRLHQSIIGAESRGIGIQIRMRLTIEVEDQDKPACVAERNSIFFGADQGPA
jgi:acyl dehydratase